MHKLEYELHRLACRLEKGTILPSTAARRLFGLATVAHSYIEDPDAIAMRETILAEVRNVDSQSRDQGDEGNH
jgi:hypothetical protein